MPIDDLIDALADEGVEVRLDAEPEYDDPAGHFEFDEDTEHVLAGIERGNPWAWFTARVVAAWNGFEEDEYLGRCSYASEWDFKDGGYYESMVHAVLERLADRMMDENADPDLVKRITSRREESRGGR